MLFKFGELLHRISPSTRSTKAVTTRVSPEMERQSSARSSAFHRFFSLATLVRPCIAVSTCANITRAFISAIPSMLQNFSQDIIKIIAEFNCRPLTSLRQGPESPAQGVALAAPTVFPAHASIQPLMSSRVCTPRWRSTSLPSLKTMRQGMA